MIRPNSRMPSPAVEVVGTALVEIAFVFEGFGFLADVILIAAVTFDFFLVSSLESAPLFLFLSCVATSSKQVGKSLHFAQTNVFGLVVGPLIAGFGLQQKLLGVGAMAEQSGDGNQYGQNRNGDGNRNDQRTFGVLGSRVAFEFVHDFSSGGFSCFRLAWAALRTNSMLASVWAAEMKEASN